MTENKTDNLYKNISRMILSGEYPTASCLPSERDISKTFKVSRVTVRAALKKLEKHGLLEIRKGKGAFVRQSDSSSASTMNRKTIILVSGLRHPSEQEDLFNTYLIKEMTPLLSIRHQNLTVVPLHEQNICIDEILRDSISSRQAKGIIIVPPVKIGPGMKRIIASGIPMVSLGRLETQFAIPFVQSDHRFGTYSAARHLIDEHGHKTVALLTGPSEGFTMISMQREGYKQALRDSGLAPIPSLEPEITMWDESSGFKACSKILETNRNCRAFIVTGGEATIGVMKALKMHGLNVPGDAAVVSYTDFPWLRPLMPIPMTAVSESFKVLAWNLLDMLDCNVNMSLAPVTQRVLIPEFIKRHSCGCPYVKQEV